MTIYILNQKKVSVYLAYIHFMYIFEVIENIKSQYKNVKNNKM